jgi:hypothetical protein
MLNKLTIAEAREKLATKEFSAVELTEAHLAAMDAAKGLNAFITPTPDVARARAERATSLVRTTTTSSWNRSWRTCMARKQHCCLPLAMFRTGRRLAHWRAACPIALCYRMPATTLP